MRYKEEIQFNMFSNPLLKYIEQNFKHTIFVSIVLIGFILRIIAANRATGILHPDEIYQSLEMSHYIVFGSGYIPPEFRLENQAIPSYASSRSFIFPLIFAGFMNFGKIFHLDYHTQTLPLIRFFLACNSTLLIPAIRKFTQALTEKKDISLIAAIFVAFWFRIIEFTVRPFTNTFFLPILFFALAYALIKIKKDEKMGMKIHLLLISGFGISTYVRTDLGVVVFSIFLFTLNIRSIKKYLIILVDGALGWFIGAYIDYSYYGKWFVVPINWFTFNIIEHKSDIFGLSSSGYYAYEVLLRDYLILWIGLILVMIIMLAGVYLRWNKFRDLIPKKEINVYYQLLGINILSWIIFSNPWRVEGSHKEIRFIIATLILTLVLISSTLYYAATFVHEFVIMNKIRQKMDYIKESEILKIRVKFNWIRPVILGLFLILLLIQTNAGFQSRYHREIFTDVNEGLEIIGNNENVSGVIILSVWYYTGGYTYLHQNSSVEMRFYSLRNEDSQDLNLYFLRKDLENETFNYFLIPYYELKGHSEVIDYAIDSDWQLLRVVGGSSEIWYRPINQTST